MNNEIGIYHQKKDNIYIAKVFHKRKEFYVGGFRTKEEAIQKRNEAKRDILAGNTSKYKSRPNGVPKIDQEWDLDPCVSIYNDPEYKLRYAVLMGAMKDMCYPERKRDYKESRKWILGECRSEDTYSFVEICELFKLNASAVREKVLNIDEETKKRITNYSCID